MSIEVDEKEIKKAFAELNNNGVSLMKIKTEKLSNGNTNIYFDKEEIEYLKSLTVNC